MEKLSAAIVFSLENGRVSQELLEPLPKENHGAYQREALILGSSAAMRQIFDSYSTDDQVNFRESLVSAIKGWSSDGLKSETLADLIYLACDTETYDALQYVIGIVDKLGPLEGESEIMGGSLGLLMDFALEGDEEEKQFAIGHLNRWFMDPRFHLFAGSIMNSVCLIKPAEFPKYFPRFLEVARSNPDDFLLDECIRESISVVTPEKMRELLDELPDGAKELLQAGLA